MLKNDKREKDRAKELETPEEKRARRWAEKMAKSRREKEKLGWNEEHLGYTNESNPFGDSSLFEPFVWQKKLEAEGKSNLDEREIKKMQKRKMIENREELEKVKKRRLERERERNERDREQEMMQREKEAAYYREWEKQEDTFHLQQAKMRSKIRISDGTAKAIDLLAHYIGSEDDETMIAEVTEPYDFLNGLKMVDLEDLLEDIKVYLELEQGKNVDYWKDITIVAEDELKKLRRADPSCPEHFTNRNPISSNPAVREKVEVTFKNTSMPDLYVLEKGMREKLKGGEGIDVGHWEDMLEQLKAHMARRRLKEKHQELLKDKLLRLQREQCIETGPLFPAGVKEEEPSEAGPSTSKMQEDVPSTSGLAENSKTETGNESDGGDDDNDDNDEDPCIKDYVSGRYSPVLIQPQELPVGVMVVDLEEDLIRLQFARKSVLTTGQAERDEEEEFMKRARAGMNDEEAQFSVEVQLKPEASIWSDKYKPRKPRFFNRVHTGFEWNKYNQTHYDVDNPPPKVVQGYKFNIFYPDLIDKSKIPQYKVIPCEDKNFATIRFSTGAPYEDIAFKIVNREWEHSYKRGFRCQFQNNILQLWFHFRRLRYRR